MTSPRKLPARRHGAVARQRLGFLPSLEFWNDWSRQRLVLPLLLLALPVAALAQFLAMWLHVSGWLVWPVAIAWPFVLMGLVERHVRKQGAERKALEPVAPMPQAQAATASSPRVFLSLAALCGVGALLAAFEVTGLVALGVMLLAVAIAVIPGAVSSAARRLATGRSDGGPPSLPPSGAST